MGTIKTKRFAALAALIVNVAGAYCSPSHTPIVDLGYAKYRGATNGQGVNEFLGIRFAAPPVGDLRWRAPADPKRQRGVQDATEFKAVCPGENQAIEEGVLEEDCLFLNVFAPTRPKGKRGKKLPVWVYIQGGGYTSNAGGNYNGTEMIVASGHDVIHVNINYRVAQLGFLGGLGLSGGDGDYNVGLLDQWKALEWVQSYIHLFGGDRDHVVVHGSSAGAGGIADLLYTRKGKNQGLFSGVIMDAIASNPKAYPNETQPHFDLFSSQMGCSNATDQMACLRSTDINKILSFNRNAPPPAGFPMPAFSLWFSPLIDGVTISGPSQAAFQAGKFVKVPMMIGDTTNEGNSLIPPVSSIEEVAGLVLYQVPGISMEQLQEILVAYNNPRPIPKHSPYFSIAADITGDALFICPGIQLSQAAAEYLPSGAIWNYRYNTTEQRAVDEGLEAWHNSDLPAIFGPTQVGPLLFGLGYSYLPGGENAAIVPVMQHYYFSFIKHLDPNVERYPGSPVWGTWGEGNGQRLRIQTGDTAMEDVEQEQLDRCRLWWDLNDLVRQ